MKPAPTLKDVARLSGVSTATVSRALNEPARVRRETREKVQAAVASLGYTPHFGARMLVSNRTQTVGVVIPTMENAIFAQGLQALQETLAESGVTLLIATSNYDPEREAGQIRILLGRGVDGLVLIGEARAAEVYDMIADRGVPFVLVWTWRADSPWPCVGFDNRAAARAAAMRVLELGHRRIAMIAGITRSNDRAASRVEGVREALRSRGLPLSVLEAPYAPDAGQAAARTLLSQESWPTALICGNDVLAAGAMLAISEEGLCIPEEISVVGFDDIELARLLHPPLTTVHVPHRRMGQAAAQLLLRLRDPTATAQSVVFTTELVERRSLGAAPQSGRHSDQPSA